MHRIDISPEARAFARRQRGGAEVMFDTVDLARTAHLVIDMQNGFVEPGAPVEVPEARDIVSNVNAISRAVREAGGTNVFLRMTVDDASLASWSNWFRYFHTAETTAGFEGAFGCGRHYWTLWPQMDVAASDLMVDKTRFGAFVPGASPLHEVLQTRGIDTLIVTGTLSNCCCESTAREANMAGYKVIVAADAMAAVTDAEHNAALLNLRVSFADVRRTRQVLAMIDTMHRGAAS